MTEENKAGNKPMGVFGRIINIFSAPQEALVRVNEKPTWVLPFFIVTIITVVLTIALMDIRLHDQIAAFEAQDKPEMVERIENMPKAMMYGQLIPIPVVMLVIWTIFSGILLFAGNVVLGGEIETNTYEETGSLDSEARTVWGGIIVISGLVLGFIGALIHNNIKRKNKGKIKKNGPFKKIFSMVAWSGLVGICGFIVQSLLILMKGTAHSVTTSLAIVLPTPAVGQSPSVLYRILTQFDIFALWQMWIWVIGVSVLFRFTKQKSAAMVFTIWGLWAMISVALASLFGNAMGV